MIKYGVIRNHIFVKVFTRVWFARVVGGFSHRRAGALQWFWVLSVCLTLCLLLICLLSQLRKPTAAASRDAHSQRHTAQPCSGTSQRDARIYMACEELKKHLCQVYRQEWHRTVGREGLMFAWTQPYVREWRSAQSPLGMCTILGCIAPGAISIPKQSAVTVKTHCLVNQQQCPSVYTSSAVGFQGRPAGATPGLPGDVQRRSTEASSRRLCPSEQRPEKPQLEVPGQQTHGDIWVEKQTGVSCSFHFTASFILS